MAPWLANQLIERGVMTTDRVTVHAKPRRCPDCGIYVLVGLDDLLPSKVSVDLHPTTTTGECFAQLTGRRTYGCDNGELYERDAGRIAYHSADHIAVHATHQCHAPPLPINALFLPAKPNNQEDPCPF